MHLITRRAALTGLAAGAAALLLPRRSFADELAATPRVTEGPYYPDRMPLDTDNDLIIVNDAITPAVGQITHLHGKVLTLTGAAVRGAMVEIWQVDGRGAYLNTTDPNHATYDTNFQGYGRFLTDREGRYAFRTIKPIPYTGRTPHIHVAVSVNGKRLLTTQALIKGHPGNEGDMVYRSAGDAKARQLLLADFIPLEGSRLNELTARFDLVLGVTPEAPDEPVHGGIGKHEAGGGFGGPMGPRGPRGREGPPPARPEGEGRRYF